MRKEGSRVFPTGIWVSLGVSDPFLLYTLPGDCGLVGLSLSLLCSTSPSHVGFPKRQRKKPGISKSIPATSDFSVICCLTSDLESNWNRFRLQGLLREVSVFCQQESRDGGAEGRLVQVEFYPLRSLPSGSDSQALRL